MALSKITADPFFGAVVQWIEPDTGKIVRGSVRGAYVEIRRSAAAWPWVDQAGQVWIWDGEREAFRQRVPR